MLFKFSNFYFSIKGKIMFVSVTYGVGSLFLKLLAALTAYKAALTSVDIDLTYGSTKTQVGQYFLTDSTMEVSFAQAEAGCYRSRGQIMYITNSMNLAQLFEEKEETSVWVNVQKVTGSEHFLDYTDLPPLVRTEFDKIDAGQLTKDVDMGNKQVILKKVDTGFTYVPVSEEEHHRAFCMSPIPFPRKKSTLKMLADFQSDFLTQLTSSAEAISMASRMANSTLLILPELPQNLILTNSKQVSFEENIIKKIESFTTESNKVVQLFKQISEPEQITQLVYQHNLALSALLNLEGEILEPLYKPIAFVDESGQTNLRAGSKMQLFSMGGDKLLFQVEDSVKDLSVTSTLAPSTSKISTVTSYTTVTTDTLSGTSNSYPSETIEVNGTPYVTSPMTTSTTTTSTTTQRSSTTLDEFFDISSSTTQPTETIDQTWLSWFIKQFSYIYKDSNIILDGFMAFSIYIRHSARHYIILT